MSNRLGLLDPAELTAEQKGAYNVMDQYITDRYGNS